jgi:hypothetical protein
MKSIVSQAASMSAWYVVLDSSSIVARVEPVAPRARTRQHVGGAQERRDALLPRQPPPPAEASDARRSPAVALLAVAWCTWPQLDACACGWTTGAVRPVRTSRRR